MPEAAPQPPRRRWSNYLALIGLALVVGLVWHFGWRTLWDALRTASLPKLALMTALIVAGFWIRAWKWRLALGPDASAVQVFFLSKLAGNWSPGRVGELAPLLAKQHRTTRVGAWIVADRVLEAGLTLALGLAGVILLGAYTMPWWAPLGILAAAALVFGLRSALRRWQRIPIPEENTQPRLRMFATALTEELRRLGLRAPALTGITVVAKLTDLWAVMVLCDAFGYPVGFWLVCAARCAHAIVAALPVTPDATGVPFVAAAYFLHEYGGVPPATLTAAFALEVVAINAVLWLSFWTSSNLASEGNTPT